MRVLLDTHILEWMVRAPTSLTKREVLVIEDAANQLFASPISILEMRIKWQKRDREGRRKGLLDPLIALDFVADNAIALIPLSGEDCAASLTPPTPHKDPFDEMLLVHAQQLGAKLLTRDRHLLGHPLAISA